MATICCGEVTFRDVQAVIFDKDGTLADVEAFLWGLANRRAQAIDDRVSGIRSLLLQAFGIVSGRLPDAPNSLNPAGLMAVGSRQENAIAAAAFVAGTGRGWVESIDLVQEAFEIADRSKQPKAKWTPLLPGASDLLQKLSAAGLMLGVLSSDSQNHVDEFVATYQLSHYFQVAAGVQGNLSKSDPNLLRHVFQKLGTASEHTLIVGDSQIDIQLAEAFSMAGCIGFVGGWSSSPNLTNASALTHQLDQIQLI